MAVDTGKEQLTVSVSPHVRDKETVGRIMWHVNLSLLPAIILSFYYFGPRAVYVTALCIVSSVLSEHIYQKALNRKSTVSDGSAFLTGLLLAMNLPSSVPFYIPVVGSVIAIIITKMLFGGLGYNVFNPALIGRAFLLISFPKAMTIWLEPTAAFVGLDAKTTATPLGILKEEGMGKLIEEFGNRGDLYVNLLTGNTAGSIGETSAVFLLLGGAYLLLKRYISWHIPGSFMATVAILAWVFGGKTLFTGDPLIHLLSGGLILGAFFMATDYVTCPTIRKGQIIFGVGCGARSVKPDLFGVVKEKKK
jgi:electron transport complex protein RnfD